MPCFSCFRTSFYFIMHFRRQNKNILDWLTIYSRKNVCFNSNNTLNRTETGLEGHRAVSCHNSYHYPIFEMTISKNPATLL